MANNTIKLNGGKKIMLNRYAKSTPDYNPPAQVKFGINNGTPNVTDTDLAYPIPVADGTVLDNGDNQLTGSSGGDNSTDNTTTFKDGAGLSDVTAQNLIANGTNATKIWTIANLATLGNNADDTQYTGLWFYIKDTTTLAKIVSVEVKLGSDTSNYYSTTVLVASLSVGWNWITESGILSTWTETGTVSGNIDTFIIEVVTNNATDTFVAGDVIYDLLRQWEATDLYKTFTTGYPTIDETNNQVTYKTEVAATEGNGFDINSSMMTNDDATIIADSEDTFTEESKSDTDVFKFTFREVLN